MDDELPEPEPDDRLYLTEDEWTAVVKKGSERLRCYAKNEGEEHFHLLLKGEVYLVRDHEKYCLNCAIRLGLITRDRLHWQRKPKKLGRERFL